MNTFPFLQVANYCEQISRLRIPLRLGQAHVAFARFPEDPGSLLKVGHHHQHPSAEHRRSTGNRVSGDSCSDSWFNSL